MDIPEVRYANAGAVRVAYQQFGEGPDVVLVPPFLSNVELFWEHELYRRVMERSARHVRAVHFDKRGMGCSDRLEHAPTLDERMEDIIAVMDAEGIDRASVMGLSEGGLMAQHLAVRYPERVEQLAVAGSLVAGPAMAEVVTYVKDSDPPYDVEGVQRFFSELPEHWGHDPRFAVEWLAPSQVDNPSFVRWFGRLQRQSATPADVARHIANILNFSEQPALEAISAPTVVISILGDHLCPPCVGRYLADKIPNTRYFEFNGEDHLCWMMANWREIWDAWMGPVVGGAPPLVTERRFAAVLFTDIVGSTASSVAVGDDRWRETLDGHDRICRAVVDQRHGHVVKSTGDGILATFDSPSLAIGAARALVDELASIELTIRAGLHAGECEFREDGDVAGTTVNVAARVEQAALPGAVFVSSTVRDLLLGSDLRFAERGEHELKGLPGSWKLFELDR